MCVCVCVCEGDVGVNWKHTFSLIDKAMNTPVGSNQGMPIEDLISNEFWCKHVLAYIHVGKKPQSKRYEFYLRGTKFNIKNCH